MHKKSSEQITNKIEKLSHNILSEQIAQVVSMVLSRYNFDDAREVDGGWVLGIKTPTK